MKKFADEIKTVNSDTPVFIMFEGDNFVYATNYAAHYQIVDHRFSDCNIVNSEYRNGCFHVILSKDSELPKPDKPHLGRYINIVCNRTCYGG
jgi:hypothetical protein